MNYRINKIEKKYRLEDEALLLEKRLAFEHEEELFKQKMQSISSLEELADKANHYLREFFEDPSDLHQVFQMIEVTKDDVIFACQQEQLKLDQRIETIEQAQYKSQYRYEQGLLDIGKEASC